MAINFAAASTAGLNNPGTEIITLIKDEGGNFINPPSYDKMLAYLRSGDVPCLFVTTEGGTIGDIYHLSGYSETENQIRFTGEKTAIEFIEGSDVPTVSDIGTGGDGGGAVTTLHIDVTSINWDTMAATFTADKTPAQIKQAAAAHPVWCIVSFAEGSMAETALAFGVPPAWRDGDLAFGYSILSAHTDGGNNQASYAVVPSISGDTWVIDVNQFGG